MKVSILLLAQLSLMTSSLAGAKSAVVFSLSERTEQTIDGFGASDAWSMQRLGLWSDSVQTQVADWLFSTDILPDGSPKGIGLSIWRFNAGTGSAAQGDSSHINPDTRTHLFARQSGQRRILRLARERGVPTFVAFFNSPPVHLTQNGLATNTGRDGTLNLRPDAYDDFAAYIADIVETAEREDGVRFDYVSPVNEPDGHWNWLGPKQEGSPATNREVARLAREIDREFSQRGIASRILLNESSDLRCLLATHHTDYRRGHAIQCFWNPDSADTYVGALTHVAPFMAAHSYWTDTPVLNPGHPQYADTGLVGFRQRVRQALQDVGTGYWMTELCIMSNDKEIGGGQGFDFTMQVALYVARIIHYDLCAANARSWQWWRAAGGDYKDGLLRMYEEGATPSVRQSKLMWTLGNYSRFVRPGAVRIPVEGPADPQGLMLSAFRNQGGSHAVVAINYSTEARIVRLRGVPGRKAIAYRTSDVPGENLRCVGPTSLRRILLPSRSVTTLVF